MNSCYEFLWVVKDKLCSFLTDMVVGFYILFSAFEFNALVASCIIAIDETLTKVHFVILYRYSV